MRRLFFFVLPLLLSNVMIAHIAAADVPIVNGKAQLFPLSYKEAEDAVAAALTAKGAGEKIAASVNGNKSQPLFSYSGPMTVETRGLQFDKAARHWSANLLVVSDGKVVTAMPAAGRFDELVEVPVLKRPVKNGEVIAAADIELHDLPVGQIRSDTITDLAGLVGKSPARGISANRPVRELEIAAPVVVKKNSLVQMRYQSPGMEIITSGQAMDDGAKGGVIGVRNLTSKKLVQAVVEDSGTVSVSAAGATRAEMQPTQSMGADSHATN